MFAALEFSVSALAEGVQPIVGCQVAVIYEVAAAGEKPKAAASVVLLAQSEAGYLNLMKLNSALYVDGKAIGGGALPQVTLEELEAFSEGLICLTGGAEVGPLGRMVLAGHLPKARALLERLARAYPGRLYVELQAPSRRRRGFAGGGGGLGSGDGGTRLRSGPAVGCHQ